MVVNTHPPSAPPLISAANLGEETAPNKAEDGFGAESRATVASKMISLIKLKMDFCSCDVIYCVGGAEAAFSC